MTQQFQWTPLTSTWANSSHFTLHSWTTMSNSDQLAKFHKSISRAEKTKTWYLHNCLEYMDIPTKHSLEAFICANTQTTNHYCWLQYQMPLKNGVKPKINPAQSILNSVGITKGSCGCGCAVITLSIATWNPLNLNPVVNLLSSGLLH